MTMRVAVLVAALIASLFPAAAVSTPPDVATIRELRLENNRAIEHHDADLMRSVWLPNIRLIASDGSLYDGADTLAKSYADIEFKDSHFIAYVRIPEKIEINADGGWAAESGSWVGLRSAPERVGSGTYLAGWKKTAFGWRIAYETYVALNRAPQNVSDVVKPSATIRTGGSPDWLAVTPRAVWVANDAMNAVQRIDSASNRVTVTVQLAGEPCSGLTVGFGSLWVPLCGAHAGLARVDLYANGVTATINAAPALSEGGIAASTDSVWLIVADGTLARIDPVTNRIRQRISVPQGSFNPLYASGVIWITSGERDVVTAIDARTGLVIREIPVGSKPRFLTAGGGAVWTLNQGDGTVSKVDMRTRRLVKEINAGVPGAGGEITYGAGAVWATIIGVPLTRIDASTSAITQYGGRGGDAVRYGDGAVWLTDYFGGRVWRIPRT
ncbi:MAG: DUF4440 domain-containing protein [Candidatus Eremiobacteraeota bacterium]|nr:DUF4440 domain-containing protein [Candidatus Eremiobacteraeota bacterium]